MSQLEKKVYTAKEVQAALQVSLRQVYHILHTATEYRIIKFGSSIRVDKSTFDKWFHGAFVETACLETYTPEQLAALLRISVAAVRQELRRDGLGYRVLKVTPAILRVHKASFDRWYSSGQEAM